MQKTKEQQRIIFFAGLLMIFAAFFQCYHTSHDLFWYYDTDVPRDMAYVQGILDGHFGKDPNYAGEYIWYNPLMSFIQAGIVKISGLPVNVVMVRLGTYLNLLAPLSFFFMMALILDSLIALAGLLSFLFLSSGSIPGFYAATYSPWMYSGVFMQFMFYINVALCYQAFNTQKTRWFIALGAGIGFGFLGHTAPTVLIILILVAMQAKKIFQALKTKDPLMMKKLLRQSLAVFIPFIIMSLPFLYFIIGKYHLHFLNRRPSEYIDTIFIWRNYREMIRQNLSVSFIISVIGFIWFYKKFREPLIRNILFSWFWIAVCMFFYSTLAGSLDEHANIHLPVTVPSFHYFFYLKALQSVFFGFGLFFLLATVSNRISVKWKKEEKSGVYIFIAMVLLCAMLYFPFYQKRYDFVFFRNLCLEKAKETEQIQVYTFIRDHIPEDQVFLCEEQTSQFPMMATARKMVSISITFSNAYVNFAERENARNHMLSYLRYGRPSEARELFNKYGVNYILLANANLEYYKNLALIPATVSFRNNEYTILHLE